VLVESPAKAKTIEKYLGKGYEVSATLGHIIDLPKNKIGVDVEKKYKPEFEVMPDKMKVVSGLKKKLPKKGSEGEVFLAMDPDREGEAIAWHTANALKLKNPKRITFHEITKDAVLKAISNPSEIDQNLVQAQFARRVLDRLVGYKLSQLLWKKMWYGLSGGRVQSVALRLIVEREEEINKFIPEEFWEIFANAQSGKKSIKPALTSINGKKYTAKNSQEVDEIEKSVVGEDLVVEDVKKKAVSKHAYPPFTTSTLQQAANNLLGYTAKRTMAIAQILYQGGYITYMRTDSVNLSEIAIKDIRKKILTDYGQKYLPEKPNYYKNKARISQEAHEAIRPTDVNVSASVIEQKFGKIEAKLYTLILKRAIASQMSNRESEILTASLTCKGRDGKNYGFKLSGEKVTFEGYRVMWGNSDADGEKFAAVENVEKGEVYNCKELEKFQKFTKPKPRYTEATLVKKLESYGIGRPSTYATIISTIIERGYVGKLQKMLFPKDVGIVVNGFLKKNFERLVDYEYTAKVEGEFDDIAEGKLEYFPFIDSQYKPLVDELDSANKNVNKEDVVVLGDSEEKCPECGGPMIVKLGKYGKFLSCKKFPECKGIKGLNGDNGDSGNGEAGQGELKFDEEKFLPAPKCPKCGKEMHLRSGRFGNFWACVDYPKCKGVASLLLKEKCPECGSPLVERKGRWGKSFTGCSGYPKCRYIKKNLKSGGRKGSKVSRKGKTKKSRKD